MAKASRSRTLDKPPRQPKPKFVMQAPNDDIAAYGWALKNIRHPTAEKDIAGRPVFNIRNAAGGVKKYGPDVQFLCPSYVEMQLDNCPRFLAAVQKAKAAGWTPEAIKKINAALVTAFNEQILVDVAQNFYQIAPMLAEFYAAREAHTELFGSEDEDD